MLPGVIGQRTLDWDNAVADHPINRDLKIWLKACDGRTGKTWYDLTRNRNDADINANLASFWAQGDLRPGGMELAGNFNGTADFGDLGTDDFGLVNDVSMDAWFKVNTLSGVESIWSKDTGNGDKTRLFVHSGSDDKIKFKIGSNDSLFLVSTNAVNLNQWYHATGTFNDSVTNTGKLYVDGVQNATGTRDSLTLTGGTDGWAVGRYNSGLGQYLAGCCDDFRLWSRELTASEVYAMHIDDMLGNPQMLNWWKRKTWPVTVAAGPAGNVLQKVDDGLINGGKINAGLVA